MNETKIFTANGEPHLELELSSTTDAENGKFYINAKILKCKSKESFDVVIEDMNKFDMHNCKYFVVLDRWMGKTYEYIVFTAGYKEHNRIVIIDAVNMTYSVTRISGAIFFNEFSIDVNSQTLIAESDVTLTDGYGNKIKLRFLSPVENFERIFENIRVSPFDMPRNIYGSKIKFYLKDGTMSGHSDNIFKYSDKWLDNINIKEVETMLSKKKNETNVTDTTEVDTETDKKEEPTPREIISKYAEKYDNMTKDAIRGNEVFGLLSPVHRLSIAAHLDQIVEILEGYIGK